MKKALLYILLLCTTHTFAGITTYTFTNPQWASKQGTVACDGKTDGWISDKDGTEYNSSYQIGVKVTAQGTGAGATSVQSFTNVRRLTINYATTTKGQGSIRVQIGENSPIDSLFTLSNPHNRDLTIVLPEEQTGKITFIVNCTKNSIFLNSISIRSAEGASPEFTQSAFRLGTIVLYILTRAGSLAHNGCSPVPGDRHSPYTVVSILFGGVIGPESQFVLCLSAVCHKVGFLIADFVLEYIGRIAVAICYFAQRIDSVVVGIDGVAVGRVDSSDSVYIVFADHFVVVAHQHRRSAVSDTEYHLVGVA